MQIKQYCSGVRILANCSKFCTSLFHITEKVTMRLVKLGFKTLLVIPQSLKRPDYCTIIFSLMYFRLAVIFQMYSENSDNNIATIWYVTQLRLCCLLETFKTYFNPKVNKFKSCQQCKKNHCLQAKLVENCTSKVLAFSFQCKK